MLASAFASRGLAELLRLHRAQASQEARRELTQALQEQLADERPVRDLITDLRDMAQRLDIPDHEVVAIVSTDTHTHSHDHTHIQTHSLDMMILDDESESQELSVRARLGRVFRSF